MAFLKALSHSLQIAGSWVELLPILPTLQIQKVRRADPEPDPSQLPLGSSRPGCTAAMGLPPSSSTGPGAPGAGLPAGPHSGPLSNGAVLPQHMAHMCTAPSLAGRKGSHSLHLKQPMTKETTDWKNLRALERPLDPRTVSVPVILQAWGGNRVPQGLNLCPLSTLLLT